MSKLPKDVAIRVKDIHKDFRLSRHNDDSLKHRIITIFRKKDKSVNINRALRGVSFDIKKGEFFGIVGRNGSGKSTLLKIISKIYQPTSGITDYQGKLVAFIELGVGFNPQLTGKENVYLNAAMLGFTRKEIDVMYDEIVDFAELKDFMSLDLKNYSSGMKVRLAFSVAIRAKADILILDEVLAVGDAAFRKKCNDYFKTMKDSGRTIVLVTHSMADVKQFCNKAILIEDGQIQCEGEAADVAEEYLKLFDDTKKDINEISKVISDVELKSVSIYQYDKKVDIVQFKKDFSVKLKLFAENAHEDITVGVHLFDQKGRDVVAISSRAYGNANLKKGLNTIVFDIQNILKDGEYYVNFAIEESKTKRLLVQKHKITPFSVVGLATTNYSKQSLVYPDIEVSFE